MTFDRFCLVRESVTGLFFRRRTPSVTLEVNPLRVHRIGSAPLFAQSVFSIFSINVLFFFIV
jgi:hypothetical protein